MKLNRQQGGMSVTQLIFMFVFIAFGTVLLMRLVPVYMDNMVVDKALLSLKEIPDINTARDREIQRPIAKYLSLQRVEIFTFDTIKDYVDIQRYEDGVEVTVTYEKVIPFAANVFLLVKFKNTILLN
ncbi:MAG: DUF4845 domain-containing protein [Thiomargarita sp.]|nr:DUF4845 domain-containing protein [Thiomargarita sp.]